MYTHYRQSDLDFGGWWTLSCRWNVGEVHALTAALLCKLRSDIDFGSGRYDGYRTGRRRDKAWCVLHQSITLTDKMVWREVDWEGWRRRRGEGGTSRELGMESWNLLSHWVSAYNVIQWSSHIKNTNTIQQTFMVFLGTLVLLRVEIELDCFAEWSFLPEDAAFAEDM